MTHESPLHDEDAYDIAGTVYVEVAAYVASFVEHVHQHALAHDAPLTLEEAQGLSNEDRRVLQ